MSAGQVECVAAVQEAGVTWSPLGAQSFIPVVVVNLLVQLGEGSQMLTARVGLNDPCGSIPT